MIKRFAQYSLNAIGLELRRTRFTANADDAGSAERPTGNIRSFLEDIRARNLLPRGILDLGAHRGDWTRLALSIFPGASVIMVEPLDEMEPHLQKLCAEHPSCRYVKAGAGRWEGNLVQTISEDLYSSSFLPKPDPSEPNQRLSRVTTIDQILAQNCSFRPDLVKLDLQGFEIEALSGGTRLFGATQLFIVETLLFRFFDGQPITREIIQFMAERGYEIYDITECLRRPYDGALAAIDIAFVERDGRLRASNQWHRLP